jgi:hypothetical protein
MMPIGLTSLDGISIIINKAQGIYATHVCWKTLDLS